MKTRILYEKSLRGSAVRKTMTTIVGLTNLALTPIGFGLAFASIAVGMYFSTRKAEKQNEKERRGRRRT